MEAYGTSIRMHSGVYLICRVHAYTHESGCVRYVLPTRESRATTDKNPYSHLSTYVNMFCDVFQNIIYCEPILNTLHDLLSAKYALHSGP